MKKSDDLQCLMCHSVKFGENKWGDLGVLRGVLDMVYDDSILFTVKDICPNCANRVARMAIGNEMQEKKDPMCPLFLKGCPEGLPRCKGNFACTLEKFRYCSMRERVQVGYATVDAQDEVHQEMKVERNWTCLAIIQQ